MKTNSWEDRLLARFGKFNVSVTDIDGKKRYISDSYIKDFIRKEIDTAIQQREQEIADYIKRQLVNAYKENGNKASYMVADILESVVFAIEKGLVSNAIKNK